MKPRAPVTTEPHTDMPTCKSDHDITEIFNRIINHVVEDVGGGFICAELLNTELRFTDEMPSYARVERNIIFFSRQSYFFNWRDNCVKEYKRVLSDINMPFYCDTVGDWLFLTPEPEVYTLLHELAHIITARMYEHPATHGKEFCECYVYLLELIQPKTFSPSTHDDYVTWGEPTETPAAQEATA